MSRLSILFVFLLVSLFTSGCSNSLLEQPDLSGTWELRKIIYGFTQVTNDSPPKETIVISSRQKSFKRFEGDNLVQKSRLSFSSRNDRPILILEDSQEYHYYQLIEVNGQKQLILYERTPIGYDIADGADYYYEKK